MHKFSSDDKAVLLRLANSLPVGDESRRGILSSLQQESQRTAAGKQTWKCVDGPREGDSVSFTSGTDPYKDEDEQFVKAFQKVTKLKLRNGPSPSEVVETTDGSEWELQGGADKTGCECDEPVYEDIENSVDNKYPDVYDALLQGFTREGNAVDKCLLAYDREDPSVSVRASTAKVREANALKTPIASGTKVAFAGAFGSMFSYDSPPPKVGALGEVVQVRSASGDVTSHNGMVFVKWADGRFLPVHAEHLRLARVVQKEARSFSVAEIPASVNQFKVAGLGDLSKFFSKVSNDTLINRSQKDLWTFAKGAEGVVLNRLFDESGGPLKG